MASFSRQHGQSTAGLVGYLDKDNPQNWATTVKVRMVAPSLATRQYPYRIGDVIEAVSDMPQVIIDYRDHKDANVLVPPPRLRGVINPAADYTGRKFKTGEKYEIADVIVAAFPGHDAAMWVRLLPR